MKLSWQALKKQYPGRGETADAGFTADADHWCVDCLVATYGESDTDFEGNDIHEMSDDDEADSPCHCNVCQALLPCSLTTDGMAHVREAYRKSRNIITKLWREAFDYAWEK